MFIHIFFNDWVEWFPRIDISINKACEWFLLGSPEGAFSKMGYFEKYKSFFELHNNSKNRIIKQICNYIGKPECLEEITLKMDLMGIEK